MKKFIIGYLKDTKNRTKLILSLGLIINVGYTSYNLFTGFLYGSVWFYAVAVYYLTLCGIKFFLLIRGFENGVDRRRAFLNMRTCGILLLVLNLSIIALIYITVQKGSPHLYKNSVIWSAVGYTFFRIVAAAIDIKNLHHRFDPTLYSVKGLSLSVALMSLFSLQTALLDRFVADVKIREGFNLLTGTAVSLAVLIISVKRILKALEELRKSP